MRNWEEGSLSSELLKAVYKAGYKKPSPIQMAAIPIGLQQRDVIGIAETGQNVFFNYIGAFLVSIIDDMNAWDGNVKFFFILYRIW